MKLYLNSMRKIIIAILLFIPLLSLNAFSLEDRLSGRILLQVESNGEAWYVNPADRSRCYLGRPADAFQVMRELGLGIAHLELDKYLKAGFPSRLSGKIMLDVEANGEAYYVYPENLKGYYLGRPADAFRIMRELGLGISNNDLDKIRVNQKYRLYEEVKNSATAIGASHTARVAYVVDGDTIELEDGSRVRYIGMDTPERGDDLFGEAMGLNRELVLNKVATLERDVSDKDKYGRLLRYVYVDGIFINEYIVRQGLAKIYTYPPDVKYQDKILAAQEDAREEGLGMWESYMAAEEETEKIIIDVSKYECGANIYNCTDFTTQAEAQAVFDHCGPGDIHRLDSDKDGIACESLP
jgi:endonuclease YncB( thermonuclease family)